MGRSSWALGSYWLGLNENEKGFNMGFGLKIRRKIRKNIYLAGLLRK